jgi:hypothetical protein
MRWCELCVSSAVLERKMSTRRTRQELIEQGLLKEAPENGRRAPVGLCPPLFLQVH